MDLKVNTLHLQMISVNPGGLKDRIYLGDQCGYNGFKNEVTLGANQCGSN